jgi:hypothetical protein
MNIIEEEEDTINFLACKLLEKIKYNNLPKRKDYKNLPYTTTDGAFMSLPLIHYLFEINAYESYSSGPTDFGVMKKSIFDIPKDSFVEIIPIDHLRTEIKWTLVSNNTELLINDTELLEEALYLTNYDFRLFELLNFNVKSTIVSMNFMWTTK